MDQYIAQHNDITRRFRCDLEDRHSPDLRKFIMDQYIAQRDNITIPFQRHLEDRYSSELGTNINEIEPFTVEFTEIVEEMKQKLVDEKPILQGTEAPVYKPFEQNEIEYDRSKSPSWIQPLDIGCLRADLIPTSILDSNISSCTAEPSNQTCLTADCDVKSSEQPTNCLKEISDDCGCVIDATNESSVCTVPMTSELTDGTQNEEK